MVAPRPDIIERRACMSCVIEILLWDWTRCLSILNSYSEKETSPPIPLVTHARRRRVRIRVHRVVPDAHSVHVQEAGRLLEQRGRGRTPRHGRFEDVEAILVHVDLRERPRAICIGELQPASLDAV